MSGNGLLIPVFAPIFSQELWVSSTYILKQWFRGQKIKRLYGHSPKELNLFAEKVFKVQKYHHVNFHDLVIEGKNYKVAIRDSSAFFSLARLFFDKKNNFSLSIHHLEDLLGNADFIAKSSNYKQIPYLYEEMLIQAILRGKDKQLRRNFLDLIRKSSPIKSINVEESLILDLQKLVHHTEVHIFKKESEILKKFDKLIKNSKLHYLHKDRLRLVKFLFTVKFRFNKNIKKLEEVQYSLLSNMKDGKRSDIKKFKEKLFSAQQKMKLQVEQLDQLHSDIMSMSKPKEISSLIKKYTTFSTNKNNCITSLTNLWKF